jgi:cation transport regulator
MPRKPSSSSSSSSGVGRRRSSTKRKEKRSTSRRTNIKTMRGQRANDSMSTGRGRTSKRSSSSSSSLSTRTMKAIDTLPAHAQEIYSKAHKSALKQYEIPSKRRGGKRQSKEQIAHKVAWSAVKKEYKKKGDKWVPKED